VSDERVLVPVADSSTLRSTVEYVVHSVLEDATVDEPATLLFVYLHSPDATLARLDTAPEQPDQDGSGTELLDRVTTWAEEDAGEQRNALRIETLQLGTDEYLFSPEDIAGVIAETARDRGIDSVVLDPGYDPGIGPPLLHPLEYELSLAGEFTIEEAPVQSAVRRSPLLGRRSLGRVLTLFLISVGFYTVLAGTVDAFEITTGLVSATTVTVALSRIALVRDPDPVESPLRIIRGALYLPYLLYEIVKANVAVAAVILHPRLPIDPRTTRIEPAVYGSLPLTSLANSITLTPGTLTMDYDEETNTLYVHTISGADREAVVEPIRTWEGYALRCFDEDADPDDPVPPRPGARASEPGSETGGEREVERTDG